VSYHNRIMSLPVRADQMREVARLRGTAPLAGSYELGHRDARHAAAEIALDAQAEIEQLTAALAAERARAEQLQAAVETLERLLKECTELRLTGKFARASADQQPPAQPITESNEPTKRN
jgi:hypothetical protein